MIKNPIEFCCVIPTRNSAWSLADTLRSIQEQRECNPRVIVVDSDSQDDTLKICRAFGVEVLSTPPGNMYRAINLGIQECQCEWVAYTNSDDLWYVDGVARLVEYGEQTKADLVYGRCDWIDKYGRFLHTLNPAPPADLYSFFRLGVQPFAQQTAIFRKSVFARLNGFDERYRLAADFDFWLRARSERFQFAYLKGAPVGAFRLHGRQLSQTETDAHYREVRTSVHRAGLSPAIGDRLRFWRWRMCNLPNYAIRALRRWQFTERLTIPTTMEPSIE